MARRWPTTAEDFLALRPTLTKNRKTTLIDELDDDMPQLIEADPDQGEIILQELANSDDTADRDTAAIYLQDIFRARPATA
jgi:hypothetical protein